MSCWGEINCLFVSQSMYSLDVKVILAIVKQLKQLQGNPRLQRDLYRQFIYIIYIMCTSSQCIPFYSVASRSVCIIWVSRSSSAPTSKGSQGQDLIWGIFCSSFHWPGAHAFTTMSRESRELKWCAIWVLWHLALTFLLCFCLHSKCLS